MLQSILGPLDRALRALLAFLLAAMVAAVTWQVVSRYALASPSSWTEELARYLLIWIGLLGGAYAYRTRKHLALELLAARLTDRGRVSQQLVAHAAVIVFAAAVLVLGGLRLVALTYELHQYSPALGLPMAAVYSVLPLSGMLLVVYGAAALAAGSRRSP